MNDWINGKYCQINHKPWLSRLGLSEDCSLEQIQEVYEKLLRGESVGLERAGATREWIETILGEPSKLKKCGVCGKWIRLYPQPQGYENSLHFCSQECLNFYKTKALAVQQITNQLQQKGINRVEDLGEFLVELQVLFPWNCQCDHPWTYEHHIKNCLTTSEQVENFKNQYLNIIAKANIQPTSQTPSQSDNNVSQSNEPNREENFTPPNTSQSVSSSSSNNSSSSTSEKSFSNDSIKNSDDSKASNNNYVSVPASSSSNDNNSANSKPSETTSESTSQPNSSLSVEQTKVSDKISSEKIAEIEKKVGKINESTQQASTEEIQSVLEEIKQFNKDLEQEKNELPDFSQPEKKKQKEELQKKTSDLKVSLQIELIKRMDDQQIQEARQLAEEIIIKEYIRQKKNDYKEEELAEELKMLNTGQAVAQRVQQIINQLREPKTTSIRQQVSVQQINKSKYLSWIIGSGLAVGLLVLIFWLIRKERK